MKILVLSDIHANLAALEAIGEDYDHLIFLGDVVAYGGQPKECLAFVRQRAKAAIRGNHDSALALDLDCRSNPAKRHLALATRAVHRSLLPPPEIEYLGSLPTSAKFKLGGYRFYAAHAAPRNHLYRYTLVPGLADEQLRKEVGHVRADFILLGHTHLPMVRGVGSRVLVNPGSVGQPLDGIPEASYAVIENGIAEIRRVRYDVDRAVKSLRDSGIAPDIVEQLAAILRTGGYPESPHRPP